MLESKVKPLIRDRRSLLWLCQRYDLSPGQQPHDYGAASDDAALRYRLIENETDKLLANLYWGAIWFEGANSPILRLLRKSQESSARDLVVLASEADAKADLPYDEYLAAFVLPGLLDRTAGKETAYGLLTRRARENVAWGLAKRISDFPGGLLIVLGAEKNEDLHFLWDVLADIQIRELTVLIALKEDAGLVPLPQNPAIDIIVFSGSAEQLSNELQESGAPKAGKHPGSVIRVGDHSISLAKSVTRFISKRFTLLNESVFTTQRRITISELEAFFNGSLDDWSCFSLSVLPIPRSYRTDTGDSLEIDVMKGLRKLYSGTVRSRSIVYQLPCTPASGATTLLRFAAYLCAREGFPTLIAKPEQVDIDIEDILSFITALNEESNSQGVSSLPPVLIVFDVEHSELNRNLARQVAQALATQGRRALILQAIKYEETGNSVPQRKEHWAQLPPLYPTATDNEVRSCWGQFRELNDKWGIATAAQSLEDWKQYKAATTISAPHGHLDSETLFWVAIRFFVCEGSSFFDQESLRDSLSKWILKRTSQITTDDARSLLKNIAILSSFRLVSPLMTVLRPITGRTISSSIILTLRELKDIIDWKDLSEDLDDQVLIFRHPSIADEHLRTIGVYSEAQKVDALTPVIANLSAGSRADRWVADSLAATVLGPIDSRRVNDWDWRLKAFNNFPPLISNSSKAVLHHWARCLYASVKDISLSAEERKKRIETAIDKLKHALELERKPGRDEHPGHIANTLGVAYAELAGFFQSKGESSLSTEAWESACKSFEKAIILLPSDNVIAYLAFAYRLLWHANVMSEETPLHTSSATKDVAQSLALLDRAEESISSVAIPDPDWSTNLAMLRTRALSFLGDVRTNAYIEELKSSSTPGLGFYCQARLLLGEHRSQSDISAAIDLIRGALGLGIKLGAESPRLLAYMMRLSEDIQYNYAEQLSIYRYLEKAVGGKLTDFLDMFRMAVLCYQTGNFAEGADRFRRLREQVRQVQSTFAPPKLEDYWRDEKGNLRETRVRVDKAPTDWRGEGYIEAFNQTIPLRPRHFTPIARQNEYRNCAVRFEVWGPLAIPLKIER